MQKTWLVKSSTLEMKKILEIFYYYLLLFKQFNFFINFINYYNYLFKINLTSTLSKSPLIVNFYFIAKEKLSINKFNHFHISSFLNYESNMVIKDIPVINRNRSKLPKIRNFFFFFINLFFLTNHIFFEKKYFFFHDYCLLGTQLHKGRVVVMDSNKFFKRWVDAYSLLFNIFFYNIYPLIFGAPVFKNETLSLNWYFTNLEHSVWQYYFPFFIYKLSEYSHRTEYFLSKLKDAGSNFFFITDCMYHYKMFHFFKKSHCYTIGLINGNINPWLVDYPILVFSDNLLVQLFFLKLLVMLNKITCYKKYIFYKNSWFFFLMANKIKYITKHN